MLMVSSVMSAPAITADVLDSVGQAALLMEKHGIGGLPVLDNGKLCGIITSRDVRRAHPNRIVADAMSRNVIYVYNNTSLWHAIKLIEEKKLERLPVIENNKLVGVVTKTDILIETGRHTDPLTGLRTGAYIRYLAESILAEGKELTVIFFDLNDFGMINKEYGHVYGDQCLKVIGEVLTDSTEDGVYFPGRYAGDEFIVVTAEKTENAGIWANKTVQIMVDKTTEHGIPVTVAAGVAGGRRGGARADSHFSATVDDLINMASLTSTLSKKEGRPVTYAK